MVKGDTIAILALGGAALYFLSKTEFFRGIGEIPSAAGEAARGLGSGISTIGREAGDIVVDIGSVLEPQAALFSEFAAAIRREGGQLQEVDIAAFERARPVLVGEQAQQDIFSAEQETERSRLRQTFFTRATAFITERVPSFVGQIPLLLPPILIPRTIISVISSAVSRDGAAAPSAATPSTGSSSVRRVAPVLDAPAPPSPQAVLPTRDLRAPSIIQTITTAAASPIQTIRDLGRGVVSFFLRRAQS